MSEYIYIELDEETAKKFEEIKRYLGIDDDVEALRQLCLWFLEKKGFDWRKYLK